VPNGLRANEGRETNALNCKPNTNLKEKFELSNYCKSSGFLLHAVSGSVFNASPIVLKANVIYKKYFTTFSRVN
jgi:hypothetical protein